MDKELSHFLEFGTYEEKKKWLTEIYVRANANDFEITRELQKIYDTYPSLEIKLKAMESCIVHLSRIIIERHC